MVTYRFEMEQNRAAAYDGNTLAGETSFHTSGNYWIIDHTGVEEAYGGQGIAGKLVAMTADEARKAGKKILPICSYAKHFFEKHKEYADILAM
ncbi:MAG: GNAT family N-acetyltransferase [Eubacterium sp.]|nr:GNAT family N-acetyltransferase [Eubacterium sp.]